MRAKTALKGGFPPIKAYNASESLLSVQRAVVSYAVATLRNNKSETKKEDVFVLFFACCKVMSAKNLCISRLFGR